jgi:hypothetical protein
MRDVSRWTLEMSLSGGSVRAVSREVRLVMVEECGVRVRLKRCEGCLPLCSLHAAERHIIIFGSVILNPHESSFKIFTPVYISSYLPRAIHRLVRTPPKLLSLTQRNEHK